MPLCVSTAVPGEPLRPHAGTRGDGHAGRQASRHISEGMAPDVRWPHGKPSPPCPPSGTPAGGDAGTGPHDRRREARSRGELSTVPETGKRPGASSPAVRSRGALSARERGVLAILGHHTGLSFVGSVAPPAGGPGTTTQGVWRGACQELAEGSGSPS